MKEIIGKFINKKKITEEKVKKIVGNIEEKFHETGRSKKKKHEARRSRSLI